MAWWAWIINIGVWVVFVVVQYNLEDYLDRVKFAAAEQLHELDYRIGELERTLRKYGIR